MLFSVIIPVYNAEKYISKCIESVLHQNYFDFELIIIDDGSMDSTNSICKEFEEKDSRIKLITQKNSGSVCARKVGVSFARGDYIIFIDGDDYINQGYFLEASQLIQEYDSQIYCFGFTKIMHSKVAIQLNCTLPGFYSGNNFELIRDAFIFDSSNGIPENDGSLHNSLWSKIIKRDLICKTAKFVDDGLVIGEDLVWFSIILHYAKNVFVSDKCFYCYRVIETSLMHKPSEKKFYQYNTTVCALESLGYINGESISQFAFRALISLIVSTAKNCKTYKFFKEKIKSTYNCRALYEHADRFEPRPFKMSTKIKHTLIKKRMLFILYLLIAISKR